MAVFWCPGLAEGPCCSICPFLLEQSMEMGTRNPTLSLFFNQIAPEPRTWWSPLVVVQIAEKNNKTYWHSSPCFFFLNNNNNNFSKIKEHIPREIWSLCVCFVIDVYERVIGKGIWVSQPQTEIQKMYCQLIAKLTVTTCSLTSLCTSSGPKPCALAPAGAGSSAWMQCNLPSPPQLSWWQSHEWLCSSGGSAASICLKLLASTLHC